MTVTDYPDYNRQVIQSGMNVHNHEQIITTPYTSAKFFVGLYGYLDFIYDFSSNTDIYQVTVNWYLYSTSGTVAFTSNMVIGVGFSGAIVIPVFAQYMSYTITPKAGTDTNAVAWHVQGTNFYHTSTDYSTASGRISHGFSTIAAGGNYDIFPSFLAPGPATWGVEQAANSSWHANISTYDFSTGTYWHAVSAFGSDAGMSYAVRLSLPPAPVRIRMYNDDTVSRAMRTSLIPG